MGFAAALDYMDAIGWDAMMAHEHTLLDRMLKGMAQMPWLTVYGDPTAANRFGVVSFNVNDVHPTTWPPFWTPAAWPCVPVITAHSR